MGSIAHTSPFRGRGLLIFGLALYWPLFRSPYFGTLLAGENYGTVPLYEINVVYWVIIFLVALAATACGDLAVSSSTRLRIHSPLTVVVVGCVMAASDYVILAWGNGPIGFDWVPVVASIVSGAGFFVLSYYWARIISYHGSDDMLVCLTASFALSFLSGCIDFLPVPFNSLLQPFLPLLSDVAGALCIAKFSQGERSTYVERSALTSLTQPHGERRADRKAMVIIALSFAVAIAACAIVMSIWNVGISSYHASIEYLGTYVVSIAIAVAFFITSLRVKKTSIVYMFFLSVLAFSLILGLLACAFASIISAIWFIASTMTCIQFVLWVYCVDVACRNRTSILVSMGYVFCAIQGSLIFTRYVIPAVTGFDASTIRAYTMVFSLISAVVILAAFVVLVITMLMRFASLPEYSFGSEPKRGESDRLAVALDSVARRYRLTARETEVMALVAQGNSVKSIAEKLCVAQSTVQGHMKVIYRKMDVHSKQDVIDLVEEAKILPAD